MQSLMKVGAIFLIAGLAAYFYKEDGNNLPIKNIDFVLIWIGLIPYILWMLLYILGLLTGQSYRFSKKHKCVRCGKRIPKGEVYCEYHKYEAHTEHLTALGERREFEDME